MFGFIKKALSTIYNSVTSKLGSLFSRATIDENTLKDLERILLESDAGVAVTQKILTDLQQEYRSGAITKGSDLKKTLHEKLLKLASSIAYEQTASVYLLVGINGSGKTTFAAKLAHLFKSQGKKVLFAAGDTFRAAAQEQLTSWAQKEGVDIVVGKQGQDPAAVIFTACTRYKEEHYDILIIDTAGRLQTKINLMKELEKISRVIAKQLPETTVATLLTIDGMLGQNSREQARLFHESTKLSGIVLTKMDGSGKAGIVFSIMQELQVPIAYISHGEKAEDLKQFNAAEYVDGLIND